MTNDSRTPLYVAGYPKSGSTWLTWLLGDLLDSPTGGSTPAQDAIEIACEGAERSGQYLIRKGHYVLTTEGDRAVPEPHKLNPDHLDGAPVVFIVRDPRDIVVSAAHYYRQPVDEIILWMAEGRGSLRALGPYADYLEKWLYFLKACGGALVKYEELADDPVWPLYFLCKTLAIFPVHDYLQVAARQSFAARQAVVEQRGDAMPMGKEFNQHFLRKGVAGDWRNVLNRAQGARMQELFGGTMSFLGYVDEINWWEALPQGA